ncbi:hypothetical protein PoB_002998800 [Plakobranchus ocellatus]|uniref:Uncharacterized protein n=1 Tax=Plakobranchus ocellatus TaxID=259542 RepID=A0AAV4A9Q1_9GAST|nr:hypothetical protein PoB_002998800 [Plakobranchus ocellatus]
MQVGDNLLTKGWIDGIESTFPSRSLEQNCASKLGFVFITPLPSRAWLDNDSIASWSVQARLRAMLYRCSGSGVGGQVQPVVSNQMVRGNRRDVKKRRMGQNPHNAMQRILPETMLGSMFRQARLQWRAYLHGI